MSAENPNAIILLNDGETYTSVSGVHLLISPTPFESLEDLPANELYETPHAEYDLSRLPQLISAMLHIVGYTGTGDDEEVLPYLRWFACSPQTTSPKKELLFELIFLHRFFPQAGDPL